MRFQAEDKAGYVAAWQTHIDELAKLAFAASADPDEYFAIKEKLQAWAEAAGEHIFPTKEAQS